MSDTVFLVTPDNDPAVLEPALTDAIAAAQTFYLQSGVSATAAGVSAAAAANSALAASESAAEASTSAAAARLGVSATTNPFPSIASLMAFTVIGVPDGTGSSVLSYSSNGDGGGGPFVWVAASVAAADGGMVILPSGHVGAGRWVRQVGGFIAPNFFGADPTGVVDSSAAIASAIAAAVARGLPVFFPPGIYLKNTTQLITSNRVTLFAAPGTATITRSTGNVSAFFHIMNANNICFDGINFNGKRASGSGTGGTYPSIGAEFTTNLDVRNCYFTEDISVGLAQGCVNCSVIGNRFYLTKVAVAVGGRYPDFQPDPGATAACRDIIIANNHVSRTTDEGVDLNWTLDHVTVTNNIFHDCYTVDTGTLAEVIDLGGDVEGVITITNNIIDGNVGTATTFARSGIRVKLGTGTVIIAGNTIANLVTDAGAGVVFEANSVGQPSKGVISGNIITNTCYGISGQCDTMTMTGNIVDITVADGITVGSAFGTTDRFVVANNVIKGGGSSGRGMTIALCTKGNISHNQISGYVGESVRVEVTAVNMVFDQNSIDGGTYGINSVGTDISLSGNYLTNTTTGGISVGGARTKVSGNFITDCRYGIAISASDCNVVNNVCQNSVGAAGGFSLIGLSLAGTADGCVVAGNICNDTRAGGARTQITGISIAATVDSTVFKGNIARNNVTNQILGIANLGSNSIGTLADNIIV